MRGCVGDAFSDIGLGSKDGLGTDIVWHTSNDLPRRRHVRAALA